MHARTRPEVHPYPIPLAQDSGARWYQPVKVKTRKKKVSRSKLQPNQEWSDAWTQCRNGSSTKDRRETGSLRALSARPIRSRSRSFSLTAMAWRFSSPIIPTSHLPGEQVSRAVAGRSTPTCQRRQVRCRRCYRGVRFRKSAERTGRGWSRASRGIICGSGSNVASMIDNTTCCLFGDKKRIQRKACWRTRWKDYTRRLILLRPGGRAEWSRGKVSGCRIDTGGSSLVLGELFETSWMPVRCYGFLHKFPRHTYNTTHIVF
jgi:hypothetical protein